MALQMDQAERGIRRERPPLHLPVRCGRQVGNSPARHGCERIAQRTELHLSSIDELTYSAREAVEPAPLVNPLLSAGPAAELLAIIGENGQPVSGPAKLAQIAGCFLWWPEGDEISQSFVDRKERDLLAVTFGPVRRVKLLGGEPRYEKMPVVYQRVADAGIGQVGRQLRLPDALGEPQPARVHSKAAVNRFTHPLDLLHPVGSWQGSEYRLVKSSEEQLDLPVGYQAPQQIQVRCVMPFEPLQQRPGEMQDEGEEPTLGQSLYDWPVDILNVLLEDVVEVADRLVQVKPEDEPDRSHALPKDK
jgi:hypothetical protein